MSREGPNTTSSTADQALRPDWLLYTVPSIAFVIGLFLFTLICKTQRPKEREVVRGVSAVKSNTNGTTEHTNKRPGFTGVHTETETGFTKQEAQSYENVSAVIYSNQNKVTYHVSQDEDYITPDVSGDEVTEQNHNSYLHPPQQITDTDGESYENMEACVYAQPRKNTPGHTLDDDESYENMEGDVCSYRPHPGTHNSTQTLDDESYVRMDSVQAPSDGWMVRSVRGESERTMERERQGAHWTLRQKTV